MNEPFLPPHDSQLEAAALSCVLQAGDTDNQAEVDALLMQLRPEFFFELKHKNLMLELTQMRMSDAPHSVSTLTLTSWLKGRLDDFGGLAYIAALPNQAPSIAQFPEYRRQLVCLAKRRLALSQSQSLADSARNGDIDLADLRANLAGALDSIDRSGAGERPMIETWTATEAAAYVPDPATFLIGEGIISSAEITLLAGPAGAGKSRLANTLAFAGARGNGHWMGYEVRRRFKTLVLQSENNENRIKEELACLPMELAQYVKISLPCEMAFARPEFRQELRRIWDSWRFDVIVIDNLNDVSRADGREDFLEAIANIKAALPRHPETPSIILIAHLTKGSGRALKPLTGRKLLDEIAGSNALAAKARTAFALQHADPTDATDDRVIFDCAKCNNGVPLPMAAYHRRNGEFQPCPNFDFDTWLNPPEDGGRARPPGREDWLEIFDNVKGMTKKALVNYLKDFRKASQAAAYKWISEAITAGTITEDAGIIRLRSSKKEAA